MFLDAVGKQLRPEARADQCCAGAIRLRTQLECVLITSMKIKVQIEHTTIASIKIKPCGERKCCALVDRSAADGTAVRDSAYLFYVLLLFFAVRPIQW